jgi:hypothetical protein
VKYQGLRHYTQGRGDKVCKIAHPRVAENSELVSVPCVSLPSVVAPCLTGASPPSVLRPRF